MYGRLFPLPQGNQIITCHRPRLPIRGAAPGFHRKTVRDVGSKYGEFTNFSVMMWDNMYNPELIDTKFYLQRALARNVSISWTNARQALQSCAALRRGLSHPGKIKPAETSEGEIGPYFTELKNHILTRSLGSVIMRAAQKHRAPATREAPPKYPIPL